MKVGAIVAANVRRLRVKQQLSQEKLAADARIAKNYVSLLELGKLNPSIAVLQRVATALGCDIRDLFDPVRGARPVKPLPGGRRKR